MQKGLFLKGRLLRFVALGLLLSAYTQLASQTLKYKHFTTQNGLPHDIGYDMLQAKDGKMWFGTDDGLSIYDGQNFTNYTQYDGLNGAFIITLSQDINSGKIYLGTYKTGVNCVDENYQIQTDCYPQSLFNSKWFYQPRYFFLKNGTIIANDIDPNKAFQVAIACPVPGTDTFDVKRFYLTEQNGKVKQVDWTLRRSLWPALAREKYKIADLPVRLWQRSTGEVYLATSLGFYEIGEDKQLSIPFPELPVKEYYRAVDEDADGNIWIAGEEKLYQIDVTGHVRTFSFPAEDFTVHQIKAISRQRIYLMEANRSLLISWNLETGSWNDIYKPLGITTGLSFIQKDTENNLWISTDGSGIYNVYNHNFTNYNFPGDSKKSFINDINEDDKGNIWAASRGGLLKKVNESWETWVIPKNPLKPSNKNVKPQVDKVFFRENDGIYFTYSDGMLKVLGKNKSQVSLTEFYVHTLLTQDNQFLSLVAGHSEDSLNSFEFFKNDFAKPAKVEGIPYSDYLDNSKMRTFLYFKDKKENTWVSFGDKLVRSKGDEYAKLSKNDGLGSHFLNDVAESSTGILCFATEKGVFIYSDSSKPKFTLHPSLLDIPIRHLVYDSRDHLWMGTPKGLYHWDGVSLTHFTKETGLITDDVKSLLVDKKQRLWIGTGAGISMLDLKSAFTKSDPPILYFQDIQVNDSLISHENNLDILQKSKINVHYTAITFIASNNLQYQYKLRDFDPWQITSSHVLPIDNLESGDYKLQIRAKKLNSDWSQPIKWEFKIVLPWYKSFWAISLAISSLILAFLYFNDHRIRKIKEKEAEKTRINKQVAELELRALQSQINPHFIFNALNAIQSYSLEHDTIATNTYLTRFSKLMRMFLESSKKNNIDLQEEIEMLILYIEMEQICHEDKFDYEIHVADEIKGEEIYVPSMLIQPFVENSIRHGLFHKMEKGNLSIQLYREGKEIMCIIEDDGIGRKAAEKFKANKHNRHVSRAMQIVNDRLATQNILDETKISIKIEDKSDQNGEATGTIVRIKISDIFAYH